MVLYSWKAKAEMDLLLSDSDATYLGSGPCRGLATGTAGKQGGCGRCTCCTAAHTSPASSRTEKINRKQ